MVATLIEPVAHLIEAFARLPGIGPKTAQRLTFHLLRTPEAEARTLAAALIAMREQVVFCERCFNISDADLCPICRDPGREQNRMCVVEEPLDVLALERTGEFKGGYHVLKGALSPVDGIGPDQLRLRELVDRVHGRGVAEVIVATNPTAQGEATALYIARILQAEPNLRVTRIARGVPMGSDLEFSDQVTLARALSGRKEI